MAWTISITMFSVLLPGKKTFYRWILDLVQAVVVLSHPLMREAIFSASIDAEHPPEYQTLTLDLVT